MVFKHIRGGLAVAFPEFDDTVVIILVDSTLYSFLNIDFINAPDFLMHEFRVKWR